MNAITVRHLTKRFGDVTAVDDLSFDIEHGTITGFVGPNGSGKTTTLRAILGLNRADHGSALIDGLPYGSLDRPAAHVGAVLEPSFHPGRSGRDHLRVVAAALGVPAARVSQVLEEVGLTAAAARAVKGYSQGMRQRLALGTALLAQPPVLVLDEPTNGLDPEGVHWLRGFLRRHTEDGGSVLVSSHHLAELALAADHIVMIKSGRLVTQGSIDEITRRLSAGVHVRTPDADTLMAVLQQRGIHSRRVAPDALIVHDSPADAVGAAIAESGTVVYELRVEHPNLEDTFLTLTSKEDQP
jgi:ABC-2 type transport system ATP-binding protein